jgi:hypothetical protein
MTNAKQDWTWTVINAEDLFPDMPPSAGPRISSAGYAETDVDENGVEWYDDEGGNPWIR